MSNYLLSHTGAQADYAIGAALNLGTDGPASYRNKLGNCGFLVNQLGTSFTLQPGAYVPATSDLWGVHNGTDRAVTVSIAGDSWMIWEGRRINLLYITAQSSPTSGSVFVSQRIENCNTLAGKAACLSYLALTQAAGVPISASWGQNFGSGGSSPVSGSFYPANVPTSNISTRYSTTANISGIGAATMGAGNHLQITLEIPVRSTNPFFLGIPQLEEGTKSTPVEFVEGWVDWARCLRRYWSFSGAAIPGYLDTTSSTSRFVNIPFPEQMFYPPSIATTGNYTWSVQTLTRSFVVLASNPGTSTAQATLGSLIADARI